MAQQREPAGRLRRYPPLSGALVATLLAVFVLPSALNVPQSNPSQTLEFAPVPPQDDEPPPPAIGNTSHPGLGSSATAPGGSPGDAPGDAGAGLPPPPEVPEGAGQRPVTKRCVGAPPQQTEDPLSPPCVAHFEGDNGGATAPGVSGDEIRVLYYFPGQPSITQAGTSRPTPIPADRFYDLDDPPDYDDEPTYVELIRTYATHFNTRYQTYERRVHFIVHYGRDEHSPESRRADVAHAAAEYGPFFAVISNGGGQTYVDAWLQKDTVVFHGTSYTAGQPVSLFQRNPGMLWSYVPSVEERARIFVGYACTKAVPHPVSFSGDPGMHGRERVFGILHTTVADNYIRYAELIRQGIEGCGGEVAEVQTFEGNDAAPGRTDRALANMAAFQRAGVTTIIWPGAQNGDQTTAASNLAYYPEWLLAGDRSIEGNLEGRLKDQSQWANARAVTTYTDMSDLDTAPCFRAAREVRPDLGRIEIRNYGCDFYPDMRQLFTGIQVAGPRLTVPTMDQGFHAIPPKPSAFPTTASCFYRPGDYTCVKDSQAQWWDPSGKVPGHSSTGCWRMVQRGARYLAEQWPAGDVDAQRDVGSDPCNAQSREPQ